MNRKARENEPIHPWFITGFIDAEGCFTLKCNPSEKGLGWKIQLEFVIGLHVSDLELLKEIQFFFGGVGRLTTNDKIAVYSVRSLKEILNYILPHFDVYSLHTQKKADYLLFKCAALLLNTRSHLKLEGLQEIVNIRASMNRGLSHTQKNAFPNTVPVQRPLVLIPKLTADWVAGFVSGDGGFGVRLGGKRGKSHLHSIKLAFYVTQHERDTQLIESFQKFFTCGTSTSDRRTKTFWVQHFNNNYNIIIPFFTQYKIRGVKYLNFLNWVQVARLMKDKKHLTLEGYDEILKIKNQMNNSRFQK